MGFMNKITNGINNLMFGRYGLDILGIVIISLFVIFSLLGKVSVVFYIIALALMGYEIFRMISKNTVARERENAMLTSLFSKSKSKDGYVHFSCSNCGQHLRVPVGLGKKVITCPRCGNRFVKRT